MDLDNLKYNELRKLAKSAGIKANMKVFVSKICWNIFLGEYDQRYSASVVTYALMCHRQKFSWVYWLTVTHTDEE